MDGIITEWWKLVDRQSLATAICGFLLYKVWSCIFGNVLLRAWWKDSIFRAYVWRGIAAMLRVSRKVYTRGREIPERHVMVLMEARANGVLKRNSHTEDPQIKSLIREVQDIKQLLVKDATNN
ncbi:MAG: hypothetical protein OXF42_05450 [Candidatus Dadabacteria bacterium]|nr:hypothetical protein [Candidatus Dadabacteria bacterium]